MIEGIILFIQAVIVGLQLWLSYTINQQAISKNKGYFLPSLTNCPYPKEEEKRYSDTYDLRELFIFDLSGHEDTSILSYKIEIEGNIAIDNKGNYRPVYFTQLRNFGTFKCKIPFTKEHLKQKVLNTNIFLRLENTSGYRYTEKIMMSFEKDDVEDFWTLRKFNMAFLSRE